MKYRIYVSYDFSLIIPGRSFLVFCLNCRRKSFSFLSPLEILFVLHVKKFLFFLHGIFLTLSLTLFIKIR